MSRLTGYFTTTRWVGVCQTALPVWVASARRFRPRDTLLNSASASAGIVGGEGGGPEEGHTGRVGSDKLVKYLG